MADSLETTRIQWHPGFYGAAEIEFLSNKGDLEFHQEYTPKQSLTAEEVEILEAIRAEGEAFISAIAEKLGKQPYQLIAKLSALEIKGLIVRLGGNRYSCV